MLDLARQLLREAVQFCYPNVCAACEKPAEGNWPICASCLAELERLERAAACDRCARPIPEHAAPCPHCLGKGIYPFARILRLGTFSDPLKNLIHQMKYHGHWTLAESLADRLLEQEDVKGLLTETDCLVAVPLHRWRQIHRGYNQSEVIAHRLHVRCRIKLRHPIVRLRQTEMQTHLTAAKREENLKNAFGLISPTSIARQHVVVIDDVTTTSATLQEVGRTLFEAKPASLCAIVLAVADPKGRGFEVI